MRHHLLLFGTILAFAAVPASPQSSSDARGFGRRTGAASPSDTRSKTSTVSFIENVGQFDPQVKFQARIGGTLAWLTARGIVFDIERTGPSALAKGRTPGTPEAAALASLSKWQLPFHNGGTSPAQSALEQLVFAEDFVRSKCSAVEGMESQPGITNYFLGAEPSKWRTNVRSFGQVVYHDVWPGVDVRVYGNGPNLEQEFIVRPGGDLSLLQVAYRGIKGLSVAEDGSLEVATAFGTLLETQPTIYHLAMGTRTKIGGRYKIDGISSYHFEISPLSLGETLTIDPTLLFSTYVGGSGQGIKSEAGVAVDSAGNAYIAGTTLTGTYPTTVGVFQAICPLSNCNTPVITKFDPVGRLQYSTFLGSAFGDAAIALAVNASGEAYITGNGSAGFPTTSNAYQANCPGVFMAKLNATGTALLYSTCIGTSYGTGAAGIAVGSDGRAFLTGYTSDAQYPTTSKAIQQTINATPDAYVSIIDPSQSGASSLVYSTYLGGASVYTGGDGGFGNWPSGIAVDAYGMIYLTGSTYASAFPVTASAFQIANRESHTCFNGLQNYQCETAFVSKIDPTVTGASGLIYSTYLGGSNGRYDSANAIAVDGQGNAYIAGTTLATDFPTTAGALQATPGSGTVRGFVTKVGATGGSLVFSTFLAPRIATSIMNVSSIALDALSNIYVTGSTRDSFPTTANAVQTAFQGGNTDAFLSEINQSGASLVYSSYLGGSGADGAIGLAIDSVGDVLVAGTTQSADFPTTQGADQSLIATGFTCSAALCPNAFLTKFPLGAPGGLTITGVLPNSGGNAGTVTPEIVGSGFHVGATAALNCGGNSIIGTNALVGAGGRTIVSNFDLTAAAPGACDLVVTNADGTEATLSQGFSVSPGGAPNVLISLTGIAVTEAPPEAGVSPTNSVEFVMVSNTGTVDSPPGFVWLPIPPPFSITSANPAPNISSGTSAGWAIPSLSRGSSRAFSSTAKGIFSGAVCAVIWGPVCFTRNLADTVACVVKADSNAGLACATAAAACTLAATCIAASGLTLGAATTLCLAPISSCLSSTLNPNGACLANPVVQDCIRGNSACTSSIVPCVQPTDPNSLVGPSGIGVNGWISGTQPFIYAISFSNEPSAPVPAQQVVVTQPLGANLDLSTLNLISIGLPNGTSTVQVPIPSVSFNPPAGLNDFAAVADLRPTQSLLVNVDAKLDTAKRTLRWTLSSIDPTTGLQPANPLVGVLQPGLGGSVAFSVKPTQGLATGAQISDQASVVFDANAPLSTPSWTNTIDNTAPTSNVIPLRSPQTAINFTVSWASSDVGAGVQDVSVYVSDNGGPYTSWLANSTSGSAAFSGLDGHSYQFYSIARDLVGNLESGKTSAEATVSVNTSLRPCDVNQDGTASATDLQSIVNQALGVSTAVNDLNVDGTVNVVDAQIVLNGVLGKGCSIN